MSEYLKDPTHPSANAAGWRTIAYDDEGREKKDDKDGNKPEDGAPVTADVMDEGGGGEVEGGEEGPDEEADIDVAAGGGSVADKGVRTTGNGAGDVDVSTMIRSGM